jgi:hypothetical protein
MGKYKEAFKGNLKNLIMFFNSNYPGEDFNTAFKGRKRLRTKEQLYSYDFIYILYKSSDGKYVLFEKQFNTP